MGRTGGTGGLIAGLAVMALGIIWLLNNLNVTDISLGNLWRLWPLLIVYFGGTGLFAGLGQHPRHTNTLIVNALVTAVGLLLLAGNLGWLTFRASTLLGIVFPLALVLLGLSLLGWRPAAGGSTQWAVMSGMELGKQRTFELGDATLIALMGGIDVDLSRARLTADEISLECLAVMGGIAIKVPKGWRVDFNGIAVLGGVEAFGEGSGGIIGQKQVRLTGDDGPVVHIGARTMMGGIEVKEV